MYKATRNIAFLSRFYLENIEAFMECMLISLYINNQIYAISMSFFLNPCDVHLFFTLARKHIEQKSSRMIIHLASISACVKQYRKADIN